MPIAPRSRVLVPLGMVTGIAVGAGMAEQPSAPQPKWPTPVSLVEDLRDTDADHAALANLAATATDGERVADRVAAVEQIARVPVAGFHARGMLRELIHSDAHPEVRAAARSALAEVEYEAKLRERTPRLGENPYRVALEQVRAQRGVNSLRQAAPQPPAVAALFRATAADAPAAPASPAPPPPEPPKAAAPEPIPAAPPPAAPAPVVLKPSTPEATVPKSAIPAPLPPQFRSLPPAAKPETYDGPPPLAIPDAAAPSVPATPVPEPTSIPMAASKSAAPAPAVPTAAAPTTAPAAPPPAAAPSAAPSALPPGLLPKSFEPAKAKSLLDPANVPADPQERRRRAQEYLQRGREKLARGDFAGAEHDAGVARELAVSFGRFEDNPSSLERAAGKARGVPNDALPPVRRASDTHGN